MDNDASRAYVDASTYFVGLVHAIGDDEWGKAALGEWSVLELVAHGNRAHLLVVEYSEHPVDPATVAADYFTDANVAVRAQQSVRDLGDDPVGGVDAAAEKAVALVTAATDGAVVGTPMGESTLADFLVSRVAELVIHGLDLARAVGRPAPPPLDAVMAAMAFLGRLAVRREKAADVLLALSGRVPLPPGFALY